MPSCWWLFRWFLKGQVSKLNSRCIGNDCYRTARGCFKSDRETSVLTSSWKSPKSSCVVGSLLNSGVIELSVEWRTSRATNRAILMLWLFCSLLSRSQAHAYWNLCLWQLWQKADKFALSMAEIHAFDCFCQSGINTFRHWNLGLSKTQPETPNAGNASLHVWVFDAKRKWQPLKRDKSTSHYFVAHLAASRPKKLAQLPEKLMRSTCSKFTEQFRMVLLIAYEIMSSRIQSCPILPHCYGPLRAVNGPYVLHKPSLLLTVRMLSTYGACISLLHEGTMRYGSFDPYVPKTYGACISFHIVQVYWTTLA